MGPASATCGEHEPSPWVRRFLTGVPPGGRVLDVACGTGRHMRLALERSFAVTGIDRDLSGVRDLQEHPRATLIEADLEGGRPFPLRGQQFQGVIVTNYLWRPILGDMVACVATDGLLIYETFARGHERYGKPSSPAHLLAPDELLNAVRSRLVVAAYEHGEMVAPTRRVVQRIAACGRTHSWARGECPLPR